MRRLLLILVAFAALAAPGGAAAATKSVTIKAAGFDPGSVSIRAGDRVTWRNTDAKNHQVVSNSGAFASPILGAGKSWSFTFSRTGTFRYHDGLHATLKGSVVVRAQPAPPAAVSLSIAPTVVTFGEATRLTGTVSSGKPNETVEIFGRQANQPSAVLLGTVLTGASGAWAFDVRPAIQTAYQARFRSALSPEATIFVRPRVRLSRSGKWFFASARAGVSLAGHLIVLQRRDRFGFWIGVRRYKLGRSSGRLFRVPRRRGVTTYRVFLSAPQAGFGYIESASGTVRVRVRRR
jgi:plastocyanin